MRLALALVLLLAAPAWAAPDPECLDPSLAAPCDQLYDATGGLKLCAPITDGQGEALSDDEVTHCTVYVSGYGTLTQAATPGELLLFPPLVSGPKRSTDYATCTGPGGESQPTCTYQTRWRRGRPSWPWNR